MSTIKLSQLVELTSAAADDILLITDSDASASKKITVANLVDSKVSTAVSNLVDSAPEALDTLNELAAALGDDANFATTVATSIGTKWTQDNIKISNWDTAYGWGNHASAGYADGTNESNWDTAYSWGNHASAGYLTSYTETDPVVGAVTGIVKADGAGTISAASAGTDYQAPLTAGTDYLAPAAIGVTVQGYDADTAKYDDVTANFTGTLQHGGHTVLTNASDYLDSADIGVSIQAYDADTAKYDDTTANFTGTLQNGGSNVVVDTDIGSTVQAYDANLPTWPSSVSATEVGYLDGVTSAIQTQLDTKASTGKAIAMAIVFG